MTIAADIVQAAPTRAGFTSGASRPDSRPGFSDVLTETVVGGPRETLPAPKVPRTEPPQLATSGSTDQATSPPAPPSLKAGVPLFRAASPSPLATTNQRSKRLSPGTSPSSEPGSSRSNITIAEVSPPSIPLVAPAPTISANLPPNVAPQGQILQHASKANNAPATAASGTLPTGTVVTDSAIKDSALGEQQRPETDPQPSSTGPSDEEKRSGPANAQSEGKPAVLSVTRYPAISSEATHALAGESFDQSEAQVEAKPAAPVQPTSLTNITQESSGLAQTGQDSIPAFLPAEAVAGGRPPQGRTAIPGNPQPGRKPGAEEVVSTLGTDLETKGMVVNPVVSPPASAAQPGAGASGSATAAASPGSARAMANDPFTAMDGAGLDSSPQLIRATNHEISVGLHDPTYGWVEIKTHVVGGQVSAILTTASSEAHRVLEAQLPAMAEFLSSRDIQLDRLSLGATSSEAPGSSGGGQPQSHNGEAEQQMVPQALPAPVQRQALATGSAPAHEEYRGRTSRIDVMA